MGLENYFEVKRHDSWLYSIKDKMQVFCWLIVGETAALLFDTGYGIGDLPAAVQGITGKSLTVVLSHGHADHALGACQFGSVLLHPADFTLIEEHCGPKWRQKAVDIVCSAAVAVKENAKKLGFGPDDFDAEAYLQKGSGNLEPLAEDAVFDLGGVTARVIPMPGHTTGSVGLLIPEHKVLLAGDAANRALFLFLPESLPMAGYLQTLRRTAALDFETHYVGHQDTAYPKKWFNKYSKVAENALAGKGKPMKIPGFEEYGEALVSSIGGPIVSPAFCAVAYTKDKL